MNSEISRRGFLVGTGCVLGMVGVGGVSVALNGKKELLRPPGGQHDDLLGLCIKCDKCRSICPRDCVSVATVEDGFINARTPVLNFHQGYCDFCNKCIEVCPTGALKPFDPLKEKIGVAVIDTNECLAYTRAGCNRCFKVCEFDALTVDEANAPHINEELCNGCGECVYVCPSNVFGTFGGVFTRAIEIIPIGEAGGNGGR